MRETKTAAYAEALFARWVSRFGLPSTITSDRGPQFPSSVWSEVCNLLGIKLLMTTAYHSQASGLVERFHMQRKSSLWARLCGNNWLSHLPWVMLGLRAAAKEDSAVLSAELYMDFLSPCLGNSLRQRSLRPWFVWIGSG